MWLASQAVLLAFGCLVRVFFGFLLNFFPGLPERCRWTLFRIPVAFSFFPFLAHSCIFLVPLSKPEVSYYGFLFSYIVGVNFVLTTANICTALYNLQSMSHMFSYFIFTAILWSSLGTVVLILQTKPLKTWLVINRIQGDLMSLTVFFFYNHTAKRKKKNPIRDHLRKFGNSRKE